MSDTSTALAVYGPDLSEIGRWARDAHEIAAMAANLVQTSFVPQSYNGKPAEATAAILTGMEVGLKPMASLRSIVVINGTPALTAQALRGLAQAAGHRIWVEESTSQRAVVKGIRRGDDQVQTSIWDVQRATAAGLMAKAMYKSNAQSMFIARASSEIVRLIASDVVMGLAYSIEELQDDAPVEAMSEPVKRPTTRTARKPLPEKVEPAEPDLPEAEVRSDEDAARRVGDAAAIEAARQGAPEDAIDQIGGEAMQAEAVRLQEQRDLAAQHFESQPTLEEPEIEWELPAEDGEK
jgi:hypothetical protein